MQWSVADIANIIILFYAYHVLFFMNWIFREIWTTNQGISKKNLLKNLVTPVFCCSQSLYNKHMAHRNQVGHYGATHWGKSERNSCRMRTSHMMRFSSIQNAEKTELFSQGLFLSVISSYAAWVCAKAIWILWLRSFAKIYISRIRVYFFESKPPWANFWFKSVMESSEIINAHIHIGDE